MLLRCAALPTLLLAASASARVYPLDANGVQNIMAGSRATIVKFVDGNADEPSSLAKLWVQLDGDFTGSGLIFGTVDCSTHPAACEARKVFRSEMAGPVIKLWMPDVGFRRYAGKAELEAMRVYLAKKLREMPEEMQRSHAEQFAAEQRAMQETQKKQEAERRQGGQQRHEEAFEKFESTMIFVSKSVLFATLCATLYYLYLRRPFSEAPADFLLVGLANPAQPAIAMVRVDPPGDPPGSVLTPVARMPLGGRGMLPSHVPSPLCVCAGNGSKTLVVHAGAPPLRADDHKASAAKKKDDDAAAKVAGGLMRTVVIDPMRAPCMLEVASRRLPWADARALCVLHHGALRGGLRHDLVVVGRPDGSVAAVTVASPVVMPPFDPSNVERVVRWIARTCLLPRVRPPPEVCTVIRPASAGAHKASPSADAPLPVSCLPLSIPGGATALAHGGASHVLVCDMGGQPSLSLYAIARGNDASLTVATKGELKFAAGAKPCAVAAHPSHACAYVLCEGDGTLVVVDLKGASGAPTVAQRLVLPAQKPDPASGGALCVSADGSKVYAMLTGKRPQVHVLVANGEGGKSISHSSAVAISPALSATDADDSGPPAGRASGTVPALALSGAQEELLVVAEGGRLLAFGRDMASGAVSRAPLSTMPVEAPCSLVAVRWP